MLPDAGKASMQTCAGSVAAAVLGDGAKVKYIPATGKTLMTGC